MCFFSSGVGGDTTTACCGASLASSEKRGKGAQTGPLATQKRLEQEQNVRGRSLDARKVRVKKKKIHRGGSPNVQNYYCELDRCAKRLYAQLRTAEQPLLERTKPNKDCNKVIAFGGFCGGNRSSSFATSSSARPLRCRLELSREQTLLRMAFIFAPHVVRNWSAERV